jgi:CNT family concentrative nucleoside transporter
VTGLLGIAVILALGWTLSLERRSIRFRPVVTGVALQFTLAYLLLRFKPVVAAFDLFARGVTRVIAFADEGTAFVFGRVADASQAWGFIFAVKVLPIIIFFAALMSVLYHLGVMQRVVAAVAWVIRRTMGVTGTEALSAAANIFVGQTEAPLMVKPFIAGMTRSQIMCIMVGGFATIAGSVMAAYITMIGGDDPAARVEVAKHFMTASVMSAPAGIVMAKLMLPETEAPSAETLDALRSMPRTSVNVMDAAAEGATDGLRLALNVGAMLVAFVALLAMLNWPLAALSETEAVASWRARHGLPVFTFQKPTLTWWARSWVSRWWPRSSWPMRTWPRPRSRVRSPPEVPRSPRTRCAASRTCPPSPSRSAGSAPWRRSGGVTSPPWGCVPWWLGRWPAG